MMIDHGYENYDEWILFWSCVVRIRFILPVSVFFKFVVRSHPIHQPHFLYRQLELAIVL